MSSPGNLWRKIHGAIVKKPIGFSWLIDGMLAGSGMPTSREELEWVRDRGNGIKAVLTLTEQRLPEQWLTDRYLHLSIINGRAPDIEDRDSSKLH